LTRIPLGVAVTVEALGPLALSVVVSQRKTSWLWALLALLGVALLSLTGVRVGHLDPVGLGFAAAAVEPHGALRWQVLGLGAIVGVMSSVIPYSLEFTSLRRLPPETFAILTCLSPVVAAV